MPITKSNNAGNSGAEEQFVQLFCDAFGAEKGQYVYLQYPFVDIYGNHRTIDFAVMTEDGKVRSFGGRTDKSANRLTV